MVVVAGGRGKKKGKWEPWKNARHKQRTKENKEDRKTNRAKPVTVSQHTEAIAPQQQPRRSLAVGTYTPVM